MLQQDAENNWQFDIFELAEATQGYTLSLLAFHLYRQADFIKTFSFDEAKFVRCLRKVESGYNPNNPYHNRYMQ